MIRPSINSDQALMELKEMFPQHNPATVEAILKDQNYNLDSTIGILLNTDINAPPPTKLQQTKPKHSAPVIKQHIFPSDFLRWPASVEAVRVPVKNHTGTEGLKVSEPDQSIIPPMDSTSTLERLSILDDNSLSLAENDRNQNIEIWARFKAMFGRKTGYEQI